MCGECRGAHRLVEPHYRRDALPLEDRNVVLRAQRANGARLPPPTCRAAHGDELAWDDPVPIPVDDLLKVLVLRKVEGVPGPVQEANVTRPLHSLHSGTRVLLKWRSGSVMGP
jgi:hypothetical protein